MSNTFVIQQLSPFPPNENPFLHDVYHMGTSLGGNLMVMYGTHPEIDNVPQTQEYIILVHIPTGQRLQIFFPEHKPKVFEGDIMSDVLNLARKLGGI